MDNSFLLSKVFEVIEEFSSREFQERVWLRGAGPEVSSYEEAMCRLFDDLGFSRLVDIEWRQTGLSETQAVLLRGFRDRLIEFDKDVPEIPRPEDVLRRPSWEEVRKLAFRAAQSIKIGSVSPESEINTDRST